ncbi:protein unc-80 homolog isoform X8 [Atheta coriaria]|uniref:protein unc-80 homolog isoform X8 n=1 Tax=Dalotia coriaria TaxID=877792 RepID=UPI0031F35775
MPPENDHLTSLENLTDQAIPIPIQIFLWKQVAPFVRPKLGKLHEASCMFCQHAPGHYELKESCKLFEKVLVQNITIGLKSDLNEALKALPRWRLIQASLPHVMHSIASILFNRMKDGNLQMMGAMESKVLYTLHWILLDAAEECSDADYEKGIYHTSPFYYLFSIPTMTLFVYLFAPICQSLKESDFQNFRLENGLKIWQAMWDFRHPDAPCFTTHCKPKPKLLNSKNGKKNQFGDIFCGRKHSNDDGFSTFPDPPSTSPPAQGQNNASFADQVSQAAGQQGSVTVTATITKAEDDGNWVSSPKDTVFPETIPEESSSTEEEHVVIFRLPSLHESDGFLRDPSIYTAETSIIQLAMRKNGKSAVTPTAVLPTTTDAKLKHTTSMNKMRFLIKKYLFRNSSSSTDKDSMDSSSKQPSTEIPPGGDPSGSKKSLITQHHLGDTSAATFLDVAVLRCLFITHWQEEGIYWALHYMYNRLRDISEETAAQQQPRRRSNSLPIPKIEVSLYQNNEIKLQEVKDFIEVPSPKDVSLLADVPESPYVSKTAEDVVPHHQRRSSEKTKKRMKMADLKAFVETKLLSKSDKALEKCGQDDVKLLGDQAEYHRSLDTGDEHLSRPMSTMRPEWMQPSNLVKGKSMPSLSCLIDELAASGYIHCEVHWDRPRRMRTVPTQPMTNPIITVTEHTPTPSPDFMRRQGSIDSQLDAISLSGSKLNAWNERKPSLTRSQTDSNITYTADDIPEAPGSFCYITKEGDIDLQVVLKAVHSASLRDHNCCTLRVLEVILNLVELLMDMGVLKQLIRDEALQTATPMTEASPSAKGQPSGASSGVKGNSQTPGIDDTKLNGTSPHRLIMSVIVRVLKHLGCPHGCCTDAHRGPAAEFLRTQCQNIMKKLLRASSKQFNGYLRDYVRYQPLHDLLDFLHAYVGFCIDPSSLLSPLNQKRGSSKSPSDIPLQPPPPSSTTTTTTHSTLGVGLGGGGIRGVEGQIMSNIFKPLVTRFVSSAKELKAPENLAIYCDVRQLMTYVKEAHGSVFRRVALSALLDTADRASKKEPNIQTTRVIRHLHQAEMEEQQEPITEPSYSIDDKSIRKLLFKKRSTSSTCAMIAPFQSLLETDGDDCKSSQSPLGNMRKKQYVLTPRQSERTLGIAEPPLKTKKSRLGGIVNWFKRGDSGSINGSDNPDSNESLDSNIMRSRSKYYHRMPVKSSSSGNVGQTLQKAKRRVEDRFTRFVLKKGKKRDGSTEESPGSYLSRRNSMDFGESSRESEFVVFKERKLVPTTPIFQGMARLSFLLETCPPGSVPDSHLLAAIMDLPHSTVVSRAALLLECSYFVHCCNKGLWPTWMKLAFPMFRPSGPMPVRGQPTGIRRTHILQRAAGKMFHQWAEALGARLEEFINEDKNSEVNIATMILDEGKQKELLLQDEEEDFLDEASINSYGSSCPMALRLMACMLLMEITGFLRETYQSLPKSSRVIPGAKERPPPWEKVYSKEANRRWSMALSSMGHSQASAQSLQSIAGDRESGQAERKISFVLHEPDNEGSEGSSNTTVTMQALLQGEEMKRINQPRPYLLRRGTGAVSGGSFKRRSLKLRRGTKEGKDMENECKLSEWKIPETVKRTDSIQSKRKVSSISDRSDTSEPGVPGEASGEESPGVLSDDQPPESPSDSNDSDDTAKNMPWLKVMVQVSNSLYYYCTHQNYCHPYCYRRVMRATTRLIKAVRKVYGEEFGVLEDRFNVDMDNKTRKGKKDKNQSRKVSDQTSSQVSPIRRKDSVGKRDKIETDKNKEKQREMKFMRDSSRDIAESECSESKKSTEEKPKETPPILKYIRAQVKDAFHSPLGALLKGAVILTEDHYVEIIPVAWELLLESNQEVAACAASIFILCAVKVPSQVSELMQHQLSHSDVSVRINSILRFQVLWKLRYQVWPRMEENAHLSFKVPPPGIEFTLPSPKIGIESLDVVDSPWELLVKTKVEEVTINQERHRSLVTATKTRKKQQTELIKMALQAQDDKKREERENFLITTIPITVQAAHEPSLYHTSEEHEEVVDDDQADAPRNTGHHLHSAHSLFPSCLCSAVIQIINLLDDAAVSPDGSAVYEVAYQVIWCCLVEDSALCLRYILERLTREKQDQMFKILRHLIRFIPKLPQQAAFALYNYIIGYVMFYVRSPHEEGQKLIGTALSILWMVVHSVHGIMFKDLKQILRKEQCDASILLTANVPSAKKIIVHGPQDPDAGGIPSQFPVQEDTQFYQILKESLDFFGIDECKHKEFFLVDYKTHQIRNPSSYVRDYYFFKRSQYPQLELVYMKPEEAFDALQQQELGYKFVEIGKVLLTWAILKNVDMVVQRVVFLHEELMKLPSFPRKALESDLDLYKGGKIGKMLLGLDVLHKFMWVRLIARMFEAMAGNFAYSGDIHLFLNVLNGAVILHSEDSCILRYVMATYINAAFHFKNIFSTNGYLLIMPTLLKIYSNHQTNKLVTTTIEYAVKQFYLMNRKPFILQMFGSVSAMLDTDEEGTYGDAHKIQSSCLFNLLLSLETPSPDPLNIAELVKEEKPLKPIDFCYHDEYEMVTILDCISLCVMVVSYSSESIRGYQMLVILEAIFPCYVEHIQLPTYNKEGKSEKEIINQLAVAIKTLVNNCEALIKSYNGPYRSSPEHKGSSQRNYSRGPYSPGFDFEDESHSKFMSEHSRAKSLYEHDVEDSEVLRAEYRRPRDVLLSLVGEFVCRASNRLNELYRKPNHDGKTVELLDIRSHIRLAEIAHSLLKVSPYDPESMGCRGLQHYMMFILPSTEWANEDLRSSLIIILRRLDKVFQKISKKPSIRRNTDWDAAAGLLKGMYDTMTKYPYIMHWQHVKQLINTCQTLIVSECSVAEGVSSATAALMNQAPPSHFCSTVVRLITLQILSTSVEVFSLEHVVGGSSTFPTQERTENVIMNLIMPLCLRVGSGRKDLNPMCQSDISFALMLVLHAMSPPNTKGARDTKTSSRINTSLYQVAFLALKVMTICFEGELITDWSRIARAMRELGKRNEAASFLWDFLDFVVTHRTPLFILMQPFIFQKLAQPPISDFERNMHQKIRDKIRGAGLPPPKSRGALLMELAHEMKDLKEELEDSTSSEESTDAAKKSDDGKATMHVASEINQRHQRPSLIEFLTGGEHGTRHGSKSAPNDSNQKESSSSTSFTSNQVNASISEGNEQAGDANPTTDRSQHSSVSDEQPQTAVQQSMHKSDSLTSQHRAQKLRFVSSVEFRHSSGETSTTPLSPGSPADESSGETHAHHPTTNQKSRLQRVKPQSRKTFRLRKSRKSKLEVPPTPPSPPQGGAADAHDEQQHLNIAAGCEQLDVDKTLPVSPLSIEMSPPPESVTPTPISIANQVPTGPTDPHRLRIATRTKHNNEGSWDEDSAISQTSSTSGYRESYPVMHLKETLDSSPKYQPPLASPDLQDLPSTSSTTTNNFMPFDNSSPDCSSIENGGDKSSLLKKSDKGEKSASQKSLLPAEEGQDETTLI